MCSTQTNVQKEEICIINIEDLVSDLIGDEEMICYEDGFASYTFLDNPEDKSFISDAVVEVCEVNEFSYNFELQYADEESSHYGFVLANMKAPISLPSCIQFLMNPNIMIADTRSTNNNTDSRLGGFNIKKYDGPPTKTAATNQDI